MKATTTTLLIIPALIIAACGSSKKGTTSTTSPQPPSATPASPGPFLKPTGIYAPGDAELAAIRAKYSDVTMEKLKTGYDIYTQGACINCHEAKAIYQFDEAVWKEIIDDMAARTTISAAEKDAVYKYVLSIKAKEVK